MAAAYLFVLYTIPYPSNSEALRQLLKAAPTASTAEAGVGSWMKKLAPGDRSGYTQQMATCMDTAGQAFAVWLNVAYLLPLTYLFVRFFVRSYLRRKDPGVKQPTHMEAAEKAGREALKGLSREIQRAAIEGENSEVTDDEIVKAKLAGQNGGQDSPIRTRAVASKAKATSSSRSDAEEGFSTVSAKKGAKK